MVKHLSKVSRAAQHSKSLTNVDYFKILWKVNLVFIWRHVRCEKVVYGPTDTILRPISINKIHLMKIRVEDP